MVNYIYLDTKILGSLILLIEYFKYGVFSKETTVVIFKEYKTQTSKFGKLLKKNGIKAVGFKKYSEIHLQPGGVVFYLFNAQSNCRMVANRDLKHIFVSHGESNKHSSIKPILRIYDHVVTSGSMGVNRLIAHGIFFPDDITRNRLIMMGDTFIGDNSYYNDLSSQTLLYAPTWEGGVPEENYSSLSWANIHEKLYEYALKNAFTKIVIQPHPNLGHRDKTYKKNFYLNLLKLSRKSEIPILLVKSEFHLIDKLLKLFSNKKLKLVSKYTNIGIKEAFCDVSAMEVQLRAKEIPVRLFVNNGQNIFYDPETVDYYDKISLEENSEIKPLENSYDYLLPSSYFLQYSDITLANKRKKEKVDWLINFSTQ